MQFRQHQKQSMIFMAVLLWASLAYTSVNSSTVSRPIGETSQWWFREGAATAAQMTRLPQYNRIRPAQAKNIILFLGDGMSLSTIAAAHVFAGQRLGVDGESYRLSFEKFPYTALSRTYETDQQTPDSAGTMTAIMSGVKTKAGFIGIGQQAQRSDCASADGQSLISALELAKAAGLAAGIVTTARITHATPAATYGHLPERNWESDTNLPELAHTQGYKDFTQQLIDFSIDGGLNVALGGGRAYFMPMTAHDPEYPDHLGARRDGRDLIMQWQKKHPKGVYVWNIAQLNVLPKNTDYLLGLFEPSHMRYEHERSQDIAGEPSLAEMTRAAIKILKRNAQGFFLVVEGGRIDHALHQGNAYRALDETVAMADAVQAAMDMTSDNDTLIIVTADHSHTLTFSGYPRRGNPILGLVRHSSEKPGIDGFTLDALGLPYTTLNFANGPGYSGASEEQIEGNKHHPHKPKNYRPITQGRPNLSKIDTTHPDYLQEATVPMAVETHGGEDVAIFARGPGAASFHGELEQNVIFHLIVQQHHRLKDMLCKLGACNTEGIPVHLPSYTQFHQRYVKPVKK